MSEYKAVVLPIYGKENQVEVDDYIKGISESIIGKIEGN
jgi:hypothetical protein